MSTNCPTEERFLGYDITTDKKVKEVSDLYNSMPREVRLISSVIDGSHRISDLRSQKKRIRAAANKQCSEIDDLIRSIQEHIARTHKKITQENQADE